MTPPTIALGVDGMEPTLLDSWISDGLLPNFDAVRSVGVAGTASCRSTSSAVQWSTHFTGVGPERHGVTGFIRGERKRVAGDDAPDMKELINLSDIELLTYPELMSDDGVEVGLINPLPLWPPLKLPTGFCVSGLLTPPSSDEWVYPAELKPELDELGYRIDVRYGNRPYGFVDDAVFEEVDLATIRAGLFEVLEARIAFTKRAIEDDRAEFLYVLLKSIDVFQHCFWTHMVQDDLTYGDTILEAYQMVDELLGWIHDRSEANVVVFSDHGFQARQIPRAGGVDWLARQIGDRVSVPAVVSRAYHRIFSTEAVDSTDTPGRITGVHKNPAAYLMAGPDIEAGRRDLKFEDITPLLLTLARTAVPESYIGAVPTDVLSVDPEYADIDLSTRRRLDLGADDIVGERLHNLGYAEMVDDG